MQQCDSKYVVKYYGSYFKNSDLWILSPIDTDLSTMVTNQLEGHTIVGLQSDVDEGSLRATPPSYHAQQQHGIFVLGNNAIAFGEGNLGNVGVVGSTESDTTISNSSQLNTEAEYENRFQRAMAEGDYEFVTYELCTIIRKHDMYHPL
uniref:Mediator of RNA polymerase II transcription subunit 6 n=1 Tax=Heterorhabditis bacteriophora TaxID=37862 RepID=A0A1I7X6A1_HETBA